MLLASTHAENVLIVCTLLGATLGYLMLRHKHDSVQFTGLVLGILVGGGIYCALSSLLWPTSSECFWLLESTGDWCMWRVAMFILVLFLLLCTTMDSESPIVEFGSRTGIKEFDELDRR